MSTSQPTWMMSSHLVKTPFPWLKSCNVTMSWRGLEDLSIISEETWLSYPRNGIVRVCSAQSRQRPTSGMWLRSLSHCWRPPSSLQSPPWLRHMVPSWRNLSFLRVKTIPCSAHYLVLRTGWWVWDVLTLPTLATVFLDFWWHPEKVTWRLCTVCLVIWRSSQVERWLLTQTPDLPWLEVWGVWLDPVLPRYNQRIASKHANAERETSVHHVLCWRGPCPRQSDTKVSEWNCGFCERNTSKITQ